MSAKVDQNARRVIGARQTARVFFSSPFGGLEDEREELTKKYWPQLASMCSKAGYEFVPVDLRWGITSEMSSSASTIEVCLREMDRSDMIVGFFGQRYGWHGDNELLQKSFKVAAVKYPWINQYRDRAVTELEYLHGHLNNPGSRAACFFFRDKEYDDMRLAEAEAAGDQSQARKYRASTDGPHAAERLENLKQRVKATEDKCLAVHMNYKNPEEGAHSMFQTIKHYFEEILFAKPVKKLSPLEEERLQHDTYLVSRLALGNVYAGGDRFLKKLDNFASECEKGNVHDKMLAVLGSGGSGKTCLLGTWSLRHKEKYPDDIVVTHFVGCTKGSTEPKRILKRLCKELQSELEEKINVSSQEGTGNERGEEQSEAKDIRDLLHDLNETLLKISNVGLRTFIIIDALDKVNETGQIMKELYWLPQNLPAGIHLLVSVMDTHKSKVEELVDSRKYQVLEVQPLSIEDREALAMAMLKVRGKTLSTEQKQKVVNKRQTENPLYLKTFLQELCSFGEFFQLDAFIDSLLQANSTTDLFHKFLMRMENDYNPKEYNGNFVMDLMCCILVARQGLSELELKTILRISDQVWSAVFFAIEDFLIERSGLYGFSYPELASAVRARYCEGEQGDDTYKRYTLLVADYFQNVLQEKSEIYDTKLPERVLRELPWLLEKSKEKKNLIKCLLHPAIFWSLREGDDMYDLIDYWNSSGLTGEEIVNHYQKTIDSQLALLYIEEQDDKTAAVKMIIPFVYYIASFLSDMGHVKAVEPLHLRALEMHKSVHTEKEKEMNIQVVENYVNMSNALACMYVDTEQFEKAEKLHKEVLQIKEKYVDKLPQGKSALAATLNGIGVLHYKQNQFTEAEPYYLRCLELHREVLPATHRYIPDTLNNIAMVYFNMGRMQDAQRYLEETLKLYEETFFGSLPPDVGGTLLNLAMVYRRNPDKKKDARALYERALSIRINAYGEGHHEVGQTLLSYSAYLMQEDPLGAAEKAARAAKIYEESLGLAHISTLMALENVALAYVFAEKNDEAHPYLKKAGEELHKQGRMDSSIPQLNAVMVDHYLNTGQNKEAWLLLQRLVPTNFASDRDFAALDYLDEEIMGENKPKRPFEHTVDYGLEKFPSSQMLFGRKLPQLAGSGDAKTLLSILGKGDFGAEEYNGSYKAFVEKDHRKEGMAILIEGHEKFPSDTVIAGNLANAYAFCKSWSKASEMYQKLVSSSSSDVAIVQGYARVLAMSGKVSEASKQFEQALELAKQMNDEALITKIKSDLKLLNDK